MDMVVLAAGECKPGIRYLPAVQALLQGVPQAELYMVLVAVRKLFFLNSRFKADAAAPGSGSAFSSTTAQQGLGMV